MDECHIRVSIVRQRIVCTDSKKYNNKDVIFISKIKYG